MFKWIKIGRAWYRLQYRLVFALSKVFKSAKSEATEAAQRLADKDELLSKLSSVPAEARTRGSLQSAAGEVARRFGWAISEATTLMKDARMRMIRNNKVRDEKLARAQATAKARFAASEEKRDQALELIDTERTMRKAELDELEAPLKAEKKHLGPPKEGAGAKVLRFLALLIMAAGEFAATVQLLMSLLRDDLLYAILFAGALSSGMILLGHELGHHAASMTKGRWAKTIQLANGCLTLMLAAAAMGMLRVILVNNEGHFPGDAWSNWALGTVIVFLPSAAYLMSYLAFDPMEALRRAIGKKKRQIIRLERKDGQVKAAHGKRAERIRGRHNRRRAMILRMHRLKEVFLVKRLSRATRERNTWTAARDAFHKSLEAESRELAAHFRQKLFESGNFKEVPAWMEAEVPELEGHYYDVVDPANYLPEDPPKSGRKPKRVNVMLGILLALCLLGSSCENHGQEPALNCAVEYIADRTDTLLLKSRPIDMPALSGMMGLAGGKEDCGEATVRFSMSEITESSFAHTRSIALGEEGRSNPYDNCDSVKSFSGRLDQILSHAYRPPEHEPKHSKVYVPICEALTRLAHSDAAKRILIVHGDFIENGEVSFYTLRDWLSDRAPELERKLGEECRLPDHLEGISVYLLTTPGSKDDALILRSRDFFKKWFLRHGADVHYSLNY